MKRFLISLLCILSFTPAYAQVAPIDLSSVSPARNAFEVSYSDAEQAVASALNARGIGEKISVSLSGRRNSALYASDKPVTVEIKGLQIEKRDFRWSGSLLFVAGGEVISAMPASGHYEEMAELPVLKRQVRPGDIISAADVEVRDFSAAHTRTDTVTDISSLIGKTPIHGLSPSRPIRTHELSNPAIVKKNAIVEMRYNSPGMLISASGQAMDDGAEGDVINIRNTTSKKIVRAVVANSTTVTIFAPGTETSQVTGVTNATN